MHGSGGGHAALCAGVCGFTRRQLCRRRALLCRSILPAMVSNADLFVKSERFELGHQHGPGHALQHRAVGGGGGTAGSTRASCARTNLTQHTASHRIAEHSAAQRSKEQAPPKGGYMAGRSLTRMHGQAANSQRERTVSSGCMRWWCQHAVSASLSTTPSLALPVMW